MIRIVPMATLTVCLLGGTGAVPAGAGTGAVVLESPLVTKLDWNTRSLVAADVDGDGLTDLALVNNDAAKIEILVQRSAGDPPPSQTRSVSRNRWEPVLEDAHFRRESIVIGQFAYGLKVADVDGDGRNDLAFTGSNDPLAVRFQASDGSFDDEWTFDDVEPAQWISALLAEDLDGDGVPELALLGKRKLLVFRPDGRGFGVPEDYPLSEDSAFGIRAFDVDGDGRKDLVYLINQDKRSLRVRLQRADGGVFGPEISFPLEMGSPAFVPNLLPGDVPGDGVHSFIESRSRLIRFFRLGRSQDRPLSLEDAHLTHHATRTTGRQAVRFAWGDFDGDGLTDLVTADAEEAMVHFFRQDDSGQLGAPRSFPSLQRISQLASCDVDGDGRDELAVISEQEAALGLARYDRRGRFLFPELVPFEGEPLALAALPGGESRERLLVVRERDDEAEIVVIGRVAADASWDLNVSPIGELRRNPQGLLVSEFNGRPGADVVLLMPRDAVRLFSVDPAGSVSEAAVDSPIRRGMLEDIDRKAAGVGDLDGDGIAEILVAADGFVRAIGWNADGSLRVVDQVNARDREDALSGPAVVDFLRDGVPDLVAYEERGERLQRFTPDAAGVFRYRDSLDTGKLDLEALLPVDFGGGMAVQLVAVGRNRIAFVDPARSGWRVEDVASYETDLEDVRYTGLFAAELNGGGESELIALDGSHHVMEILRHDEAGWRSSLHFAVFEENMHYQGRRGAPLEPREIVIADLSGDGLDDVAALVHDRVLLYRQP